MAVKHVVLGPESRIGRNSYEEHAIRIEEFSRRAENSGVIIDVFEYIQECKGVERRRTERAKVVRRSRENPIADRIVGSEPYGLVRLETRNLEACRETFENEASPATDIQNLSAVRKAFLEGAGYDFAASDEPPVAAFHLGDGIPQFRIHVIEVRRRCRATAR